MTEMVSLDNANFIAVVFDHSETGKQFMAGMKIDSEDFKRYRYVWHSSGYEYFVYIMPKHMSGQMVVMAPDLGYLLNEGIPAIIKRIQEKGEVCAFVLAVDPSLNAVIEKRIGKEGEAAGWGIISEFKKDGKPVFAEKKSGTGLIDLALAPTGREISIENIKMENVKEAHELGDAILQATSKCIYENKHGNSENEFDVKAYAQDDGRLIIHVNIGSSAFKIIHIPGGKWQEMSEYDISQAKREFQEKILAKPETLNLLQKHISAAVHESVSFQKRTKERMSEEMQDARQVIMIFDRSNNALMTIQEVSKKLHELEDSADKWLSGNQPFLLCSLSEDEDSNWTYTAENEAEVLSRILPMISSEIGVKIAKTMLLCNCADKDFTDNAKKTWITLGGKIWQE